MWHCESISPYTIAVLGLPSCPARRMFVKLAHPSAGCKPGSKLRLLFKCKNLAILLCGLLGSMQLRCELHCLCAGCCAMAGVTLWLMVMTVLEVRAALAPTLHWLASLLRRLAAVFCERQVRIMAHCFEDSACPVLTSLESSTLSSDESSCQSHLIVASFLLRNQVPLSVSTQCVLNEHALPSLLQSGILCSRVPPELTVPGGPHIGTMLSLLISLSKSPLLPPTPLLTCHPCQTTWAFINHVVKQDGPFRIVLSNQAGAQMDHPVTLVQLQPC